MRPPTPPLQLGIERLIRRMLKQPHQPAVIMLNTFGFRFPNREVYQRVRGWLGLLPCPSCAPVPQLEALPLFGLYEAVVGQPGAPLPPHDC